MNNSKEMSTEPTKTIKRSDPKPEEQEKQEHVGVHTTVRLRGFNGDKPIHAKVDTGAETSSLHAGNLKIATNHSTGESEATFTFGSNNYRVPVKGFQSVSSADGGTKHRPIVTFTVYIADEVIPDVEFNLNDRSQMEYELLIGLNLIQAAKLKVDPTLKEMEINFSAPVDGDESQQPAVDKLIQTDDNTQFASDESDVAFLNWFKANKDKTLAEVFSQLYNRSPVDDAS